MREEDFRAEIERVQNGIPGAKYSAEQILRIRKFTIDLPVFEFTKVVNRFLDEKKTKPTPSEFREAVRGIRLKVEQRTPSKDDRFPNCRICGDTGIAHGFHRTRKSEQPFNCKCPRGNNPDHRRRLPKLTEEMEKHFEIEWRFPYSEAYHLQFGKFANSVPGFAKEMFRRAINKKPLTGLESDFDFVMDPKWQEQNKGSRTGLINLLEGLKQNP